MTTVFKSAEEEQAFAEGFWLVAIVLSLALLSLGLQLMFQAWFYNEVDFWMNVNCIVSSHGPTLSCV